MTAVAVEAAPQPPKLFLLALLLLFAVCFLLPGCASNRIPPQAAPAVEVKVPVPVACEIEQVPVPSYPAAQARKGMNIWDLTKIVTADRQVRMAENERLRAATNNPCPAQKG